MTVCRDMTEADVPQVLEIERQCFSLPWSARGFLDWIEYDYTYMYVICEDSLIIGYGAACRGADEFDISNIAVREGFRGRGIGGMLIDRILNAARDSKAKAVYLEVRESNRAAIALYEKKNFKSMGIRKNFYEKPVENAIIYRYQL